MGNVSTFRYWMLAVAVRVDAPGIVGDDITLLSIGGMFVSVVETSGMESGSGMFTVDECVDGEMFRREEGVVSGTVGDCVCLFG